MVKVEDIETCGWVAAIRGMRNPLASHHRADSKIEYNDKFHKDVYTLGPNDMDLALRLIKAGPEHCKFLRMIHVQMDITGPLYWWKEMDTYKVATTRDSYSTMHKIHAKEFTMDDFSREHLISDANNFLSETLDSLNEARDTYLHYDELMQSNNIDEEITCKKDAWWQMIQLLPSSYNQKATWDGSLQTVLQIIHQRKHHKLDTDWNPFIDACFANIPYCKEFYEAAYGKEVANA